MVWLHADIVSLDAPLQQAQEVLQAVGVNVAANVTSQRGPQRRGRIRLPANSKKESGLDETRTRGPRHARAAR